MTFVKFNFLITFICVLFFGFGYSVEAQVKYGVKWSKTWKSSLNGASAIHSVLPDESGGVFVTGQGFQLSNKGDITTLHYDSSGTALWTRNYYGSDSSIGAKAVKILREPQSSIYITGTLNERKGNLALLKYQPDGTMRWAKSYTSSWFGSYRDEGSDMEIDAKGNVYLNGIVTSTSGNGDDIYTVAVDSNGVVIWGRQYSGASAWDAVGALAVDKNGNAYMSSASHNF